MRFIIILVSTFILLNACSVNYGIYSEPFKRMNHGRDASSPQKAIVILRNSSRLGIADEYEYVNNICPNFKFLSQALIFHKGKPMDILIIKTEEGVEKRFYFDISHFFGKFM